MTTDLDKLHGDIMNIPSEEHCYSFTGKEEYAYKLGHRDARHVAAELVSAFAAEADKLDTKLLVDVATAVMDNWMMLDGYDDEETQRFCEQLQQAFDKANS